MFVEETSDELWQEVQKLKDKEKETDTSAPISIVGQTDYMGMDKMSLTTEELRGETNGESEANTLAMLPPFLGDYETKIEVIHIPESQQITPGVSKTRPTCKLFSQHRLRLLCHWQTSSK